MQNQRQLDFLKGFSDMTQEKEFTDVKFYEENSQIIKREGGFYLRCSGANLMCI